MAELIRPTLASMAAVDLIPLSGMADPFSSLSHLLGAVVFVTLTPALLRRGDSGPPPKTARRVSLAVFAGSAVLLLTMSGVFHLLPTGLGRRVLQRLDHAAIFVLIAGTFTPIHTILFRGPWRWGMLVFIWSVAALGVALKSIYFTATPDALGIAVYLGMGWVGVGSIASVWRRFGGGVVAPLLLGGLAYTAGAIVELVGPSPIMPGVIRAHELFHVAVLAGLGLHWAFMYTIADGCHLGGPPGLGDGSTPDRAHLAAPQ